MTTTRDLGQDIADFIDRDPTLRSLFAPRTRQPRYRYFQTPDGAMFMWTTERMDDGKYASAIYKPYGPGARSGRSKVTRWKPVREVRHSTRKAAKARALRLYRQAAAALGR